MLSLLEEKDDRALLREDLEENVLAGIYFNICCNPEALVVIRALIHAVMDTFEDKREIKTLVRNCDRLFPQELPQALEDIEVRFLIFFFEIMIKMNT